MMRNWFWLLISVAASTGSAWALPPARFEISYEITRNNMTIAEAFYQVEHDGRTYQIIETSKGRGMLALLGSTRRTSRGLVSPEGLKPQEFTDERTGRSTARAHFDWNAKTVTLQYKDPPRTEPLPAQAHDRLAFVFDLAFGRPSNGEVAFDLLDGRGLSRHVYKFGGRERLKLPIGEFDTLKLARGSEDDRTEIWFGVDQSNLPLRILVVEKEGTRYDQVVTRIALQPAIKNANAIPSSTRAP